MSKSFLDDISIIIPTLDRPEWCKKLINYYLHFGFSGHLIICDSSSKEQYRKLNKYIREISGIRIIHLQLQGVSLHKAVGQGIAIATKKSSFFTQSGDDDFFELVGLNECAKFLSDHEDYFSCVGKGYIIKYIEFKNKFRFGWVLKYWKPRNITESLPNDRVSNILNEYYNLEFSLRRTQGVNLKYKQMNRFLGNLSFRQSTIAEICSVISIAFTGKSRFVNVPYLFRGEHSERPNAKRNKFPNSMYIFENRIQTYEKYQLLINGELGNTSSELKLSVREFYTFYTEKLFKKINQKNSKHYKLSQLPIRIAKRLLGITYKTRYRKIIKAYK